MVALVEADLGAPQGNPVAQFLRHKYRRLRLRVTRLQDQSPNQECFCQGNQLNTLPELHYPLGGTREEFPHGCK